jgi:hypothetical protein
MGENSGQRAVNVYSAFAATYTALKYSAAVGDALKRRWLLTVEEQTLAMLALKCQLPRHHGAIQTFCMKIRIYYSSLQEVQKKNYIKVFRLL